MAKETLPGATSTLIGASHAIVHKALKPMSGVLLKTLTRVNDKLIDVALHGSDNLLKFANALRDFTHRTIFYINSAIKAYNSLSEGNKEQLEFMLKAGAVFLVAYKAGFVAPLLKMFTLLATGQAAFLVPMLKAVAVVAAAKVGWEAGQMLLDGITDPESRKHVDSFAKFLAEPFKKAFDPKEWLPASLSALLENFNNMLPEMPTLPELTKSDLFLDNINDAVTALGGLMNLRGALAGTLPDIMPEPDRAMRMQFDKAKALEGQQRITNRLIAESLAFLRTIAEERPQSVSFATP